MIRVGVCGIGTLGRGFAVSLRRAGFAVAGYDVDAAALAWCKEHGVVPAQSPRALAEGAAAVVLALPDTPEIEDALAGEQGLAAGLSAGAVLIVASTVAPSTPVALASALAGLDVEVVDAPVSGGPGRAETGTLAIMVGGSNAGLRRARPVLEALGRPVHVGPIGHGELAKLANNLMGAVTMLGIAEGLALAAKGGADLARVAAAIADGSGSSWILREWIPDTVFQNDFAPRFSIDLMCKDMRLIRAEAERLNVAVPAAELAEVVYGEAAARGEGGSDFSVIAALAARSAGTSLAPGSAAA